MRVTLPLFLGLTLLVSCKPQRNGTAEFDVRASPSPRVEERLRRYWQIPGFSLTDQHGESFDRSQLTGKLWVVDFFYSSCPGPCPMLTSRLSGVHKGFRAEPRVGFISVSSDPEKDTPEILMLYANKFGADTRWTFLTGDKPMVYKLANEGFKLSLQELVGSAEPISHSTRLALVDQDGWVRGFYEGVGEDSVKAMSRLIEDIHELLKNLK